MPASLPTRAGPAPFPCHAVSVMLAHQGGWDEALFVLVPLALFAFLLRRAQKRAEQESAEQPDPTE